MINNLSEFVNRYLNQEKKNTLNLIKKIKYYLFFSDKEYTQY